MITAREISSAQTYYDAANTTGVTSAWYFDQMRLAANSKDRGKVLRLYSMRPRRQRIAEEFQRLVALSKENVNATLEENPLKGG